MRSPVILINYRYNVCMSMKTFFMKKMLASQMKDIPQTEQDKLFAVIEENPKFFEKIALEVQEGMRGGKDQMSATLEVVKKYETKLKELI